MHSISLASDVGIDENIVFVLGSAIMSSRKPIGVGRVNRWTRNSAQRFEDHLPRSSGVLPAQHRPGV